MRDIVVFAQNLYSIKEHTKTIDLTLNLLEQHELEQHEREANIGNTITSLMSLKDLCLSYTNLVDDQLGVGKIIRNLAFAIYTIQKGDGGVGGITAENIDINNINIDMATLLLASVTEGTLRAVRNILIDQTLPTSANSGENIPQESCIFFTEISTALDRFVTIYLVPCVRASLGELVKDVSHFEIPDTQRKVNVNAKEYTSFRLQKRLSGEQFTTFLSTCITSAEKELPDGISVITAGQLTKVYRVGEALVETEVTRTQPRGNTTIQANFKACTPVLTEEAQRIVSRCFQMTAEDHTIRQVAEDPVLATFFPGS